MISRPQDGSGSVLARVSAGIFAALVALTPVVPHNRLPHALVSADDVLPAVATVVGLAAVLATRGWRDLPARLRRGPELIPLALLIVVTAISAVHAGGGHALASGPVRWLQYVVLICIAYLLLRTPGDGAWALRAVVGVAVFEAIFGLTAFAVDWRPGGHVGIERAYDLGIAQIFPGRIDGTLGVASIFLAGFLALALPISVGLALRASGFRRAGWLTSTVLIAVTLAFTFSRVGIVLAVAAVVVLLLVRTPAKVWVPVVAVLAAVGFATPLRHRLLTLSNDRLSLWSAGAHMAGAHPLYGVGPGRYMQVLPQFAQTPFGKAIYTAHNSLVLASAESGIVAGVLLLAALVLALRHLPAVLRARYERPAALGAWLGLAAFALDAMTNDLYFIPSVAVVAWLIPPALSAIAGRQPTVPPIPDAESAHRDDLGSAVI